MARGSSGETAVDAPAPASDPITDLGLVGLTLIWGSNFAVVKWALDVLSPLALNALRFPLACLVIWVVVRATGPLPRIRKRDLPALLGLGFLGNAAYQLLFIYGLDGTRAGNAALLMATVPVWALLLAAVTREGTLDRTVWWGVLLTVAGVGLMVVGGSGGVGIEGASLRGDVLMLLAAMSWAAYTVGTRPLSLRYGALPVIAWTLWSGSAVLVLLGLPSLGDARLSSLGVGPWIAVVFSGVFSLGVAYLLWYRGVVRLGSARTSAYANLVPVVALVVAWYWLGEVPTGIQLAGAAVILSGIVMARWGGRWWAGKRASRAEVGSGSS
ncbi:MAG: DMT family transporter [Gemmatimonadales bacterium]|nr:MAG: DMT family transporter [Gemmatimonadales bacterium]